MVNEQIETISFGGKYINGTAKETLLNDNENKYVIKGSTGIGGTTAILNDRSKCWLIVSPNVGMIKGKEGGNFNSEKQFFIYGGSRNNWNEVGSYLKCNNSPNLIINCTPEQVVKLKDKEPELFKDITSINIFIDEVHAYTADADYRDNLGVFLALIWNEWNANITLSTATPNYQFFDIPKDLNFKYYKVVRENQPKKPLQISYSEKDAYNFIFRELNEGRKVCVFSNNLNYHKKEYEQLHTANLVGNNLKLKLQLFDKGNDDPKDNSLFENDLIFLSSSYFAGYDVPIDCSICIISNNNSEATTISINNAVQCYGRCRGNVINALYVNHTNKNKTVPTLENVKESIEGFNDDLEYYQRKAKRLNFWDASQLGITPHHYANGAQIGAPVLSLISNYQLHNESVFKATLEGYGFELSKYIPVEVKPPKTKRVSFKNRIENLLKISESQLLDDYLQVRENIKGNDSGSFNYGHAFEYLTAYILKVEQPKNILNSLDKKRVRPERFYNSINNFIRVNGAIPQHHYNQPLTTKQLEQAKTEYLTNTPMKIEITLLRDWVFLHSIYKANKGIFTNEIKRTIKFYDAVGNTDLINDLKHDKKNRHNLALRAVKKEIDNLTHDEVVKAKKAIKNSFKLADKYDNYSNPNDRKKLKSKIVHSIGYLFNEGNYTTKESRNREYTALTQLPSKLRCLIPFKYVESDITSANPQFTDKIIGSNIAFQVYENIMTAKGITRPEAKTMFNTYLNNHNFTVSKARQFYLNVCGYTTTQATQLAEITAGGNKGQYFDVMVGEEKKIIEKYINVIGWGVRFHDAVVLPVWEAERVKLPLSLNDVRFHVGYLNNETPYGGDTTNENIIDERKGFLEGWSSTNNTIDNQPNDHTLNISLNTHYQWFKNRKGLAKV
ncbi:hypothetical protein NE848_12835 [Gramella jeungdoensis]|uniref:DEAD/DEAH box helicase n=1 Tax=Gramella jeungdoensis TaxID=708091 RepID=A0ABT0Z3G4_9FLAO|nr:hypothetical protein [Gramella jeungdoensis]MCM8570272.1 hypothetical protein [Gramella jeungdoensis]